MSAHPANRGLNEILWCWFGANKTLSKSRDGRVRAPELIAAVKFACANLKKPDELLKGNKELALDAINDQTEEGKTLLSSAKQVLINPGKKVEPRPVLDLHELRQFPRLYDGDAPAVFQCGTLYLDQRTCRLCLRVEDSAKHAAMAGLAGAYLAYADCTRPASGEKMQIVVAFTAGDSDNFLAYITLRKRNLGPILDANG